MYKLLTVMAAAVLLAACSSSDTPQQAPPATAASVGAAVTSSGRADVRALVEQFGKQMQKVSTLAPPAAMHRQLQSVYGGLLSPELLKMWQAHPDRVVGREVSSPWPQKIEVQQVDCGRGDACTVTGQVDYVTSSELANGGVFSRRPITLKANRVDAGWRITAIHLASTQRAGDDAAH